MWYRTCAWCGRRAWGTAIEWFWDPYWGWDYDIWPSCSDWGCGDDYLDDL